MIIVEGPDGAGKTTLIRRIRRDFPELVEGERGTKDRKLLWTVTVPDTYRALRLALDPFELPRIWDRLYYSEFVYAPIVNPPREPMFNSAQRAIIRRTIEALRVPVIICMPPLEQVLKNVLVEEQMDGVVDKIKTIYQTYRTMLQYDGFPLWAVTYDYSGVSAIGQYENLYAVIQQYLNNREEQKWSTSP